MVNDQLDTPEDVLACDFRARPHGAPTVFDVLPDVRDVTRNQRTLSVEFDPAGAEAVTEYVAAERLCCRTIRWELERTPLRLTIEATPPQLDVLEALYTAR